jgi:hypothetical protein
VSSRLEYSKLVSRVAHDIALQDDLDQMTEEDLSSISPGSSFQRLPSSKSLDARRDRCASGEASDGEEILGEFSRHSASIEREPRSDNRNFHSQDLLGECSSTNYETPDRINRSNPPSELNATVYAAIASENAELAEHNRQLKELVALVHGRRAGMPSPGNGKR